MSYPSPYPKDTIPATAAAERHLLWELAQGRQDLVKRIRVLNPRAAKIRLDGTPHSNSVFVSRFLTDDIKDDPQITAAFARYKKARDAVIIMHLRMCGYLTGKFMRRGNYGCDASDLEQEAYIGLVNAIDRFDIRQGVRLATYAAWWIRQALQKAAGKNTRAVTAVTHYFNTQAGHLAGQSATQAHQDRRMVEWEELAQGRGLRMQRFSQRPASLNCYVGDDYGEAVAFSEALADPNANDERHHDELREAVSACLECLDEREKTIITLRFGLNGTPAHKLSQVGKKVHLTKERCRQIMNGAMEKIRTSVSALTSEAFASLIIKAE